MALLLYDGNCEFCIRILQRFRWLLRSDVIAMPLQQFQSAELRLQQEDLLRAITLIVDGRVYRGAEAIARSVGHIAYAYYIPGIRQLADWAYHLVARRRNLQPGGCANPTRTTPS